MKPLEIVVLLPCHSLEDFPLHGEGEAADALLAAWSAAWHPALLVAADGVPVWQRADDPPLEATQRLYFVPAGHDWRLPHDFLARAAAAGAVVLSGTADRDELMAQALAAVDGGLARVDAACARDFLVLGHARLQVELLTRQMRYTSRIDETAFRSESLRAAAAALRGECDTAREHLAQCFELLYEARKFFYPVDAFLVDLTLVEATTLGEPLRRQLAQSGPQNVLVSGRTLQEMAEREPATLAALRTALEAGRVSVVGGELDELDGTLEPPEQLRDALVAGLAVYQRLLGRRPAVYGRRQFGLSPQTPQLAGRTGFIGAVHFTLDEGQFPTDPQSKVRWEGDGAAALDCLTRLPRDAARPESLLEFSRKMGESMDRDHVATLVFAHWPDRATRWYEDLRRIADFSPALGTFVTLDNYFATSVAPGHLTEFSPDAYRSPQLVQTVTGGAGNAISTVAERQRQAVAEQTREALSFLADVVGGQPAGVADEPLCESLARLRDATARGGSPAAAVSPPLAWVVNPFSFTQSLCLSLNADGRWPAIGNGVLAGGVQDGQTLVVVEAPALGALPVPAAAATPSERERRKLPQVEVGEWKLSNEHLSVTISPETGGIAALHDLKLRANRLSQRLALRRAGPSPAPGDVWTDPDSRAEYTEMVADALEISAAGPVLGKIASRGGLFDASGARVADFRQTVSLWAASRTIELEIELDPREEPADRPWHSYYCARFAWPRGITTLHRTMGWGRRRTELTRVASPQYVEIEGDGWRTAIFAGGWPYHRRTAENQLDTLLVVRGEQARAFKLAIGVDVQYPLHAALARAAEPCVLSGEGLGHAGLPAAWFFHTGAKNVLATHWWVLGPDAAIPLSARASEPAAPVIGFRVRLLETEGRPAAVTLSAFRRVVAAWLTDFLGEKLVDLLVADGKITLDLAAHEWAQVEAIF